MTTNDATPREAISSIIAHVAHDKYPTMRIQDGVDAIIAHLWQAADDPEVVEAVSDALAAADEKYPYMSDEEVAGVTNEALLTALLGPRPTEQERDDE